MQTTDQKLISIMGTTATGKTELALFLAHQIIDAQLADGVCLISADSKQVYQGLEILTGADIPAEFKLMQATPLSLNYCFTQHQQQNIQLHGVSIIRPDQEWSVAHFRNLAIHLIQHSWLKNWLPIIVGGTSFYHHQLFNNDIDIYIKPNEKLRLNLEKFDLAQLQKLLQQLDEEKLKKMNQSDLNNPRRLMRAIEVAQAHSDSPSMPSSYPIFHQPKKYLSIALQIDEQILQTKISQRVNDRLKNGAKQEVKNLLALNLNSTSPVMTTLGVKPISALLAGQTTLLETITAWVQQELQYAKKQLTWLKKISADLVTNVQEKDYQILLWQKIKTAFHKP